MRSVSRLPRGHLPTALCVLFIDTPRELRETGGVDSLSLTESILSDKRVALVGKLASMSRRDAAQIIERHGGIVVETASELPELVVVGDEAGDARKAVREALGGEFSAQWDSVEIITESELWQRLGLVDEDAGVQRLYTPAMLAELLSVPIATIRRWRRKGYLHATREVQRLPYFDFEEVRVARQLVALVRQGCSLAMIDRQVDALERLLPDSPRPLADPALVVEKGKVFLRRGDDLAEPSGQLLLDFNAVEESVVSPAAMRQSFADVVRGGQRPSWAEDQPTVEELRSLAVELQETSDLAAAIEAQRAVLMAGGNEPEDHFALAELLYRKGDFSAARERYFAAIELDEAFVEARANLGCVLAELGELELAAASLVGALAYHNDFADAHFHLAQTLDRLDRRSDAMRHWRQFLSLAPESPWAEEARERLSGLSI